MIISLFLLLIFSREFGLLPVMIPPETELAVVVVDMFHDLERLFFLVVLLVLLDVVVIPKMAALSLTFTSSSMRPVSREFGFGLFPETEVEDELFLLILMILLPVVEGGGSSVLVLLAIFSLIVAVGEFVG